MKTNPDESFLDKFIMFLSPRAGTERLRYKLAASHIRGMHGYDAATKGRRLKNWKASNSSINAETEISLPTLRNRSRDLIRNNTYASRFIDVVESNTVGAGIVARIKASDTKNKSLILKSQDFHQGWKDWAETGECSVDEKFEFYALQALVARTVASDGEIIVKRIRNAAKETAPFEIELLEADYLDDTKNNIKTAGGGLIIQGVEFNSKKKRVAYWLFDEHPGSSRPTTLTSRRVLAEDVLHVFRPIRAGQVRGIPWLATAMVKFRDLDEYDDATLMKHKVSACFSGFIEDAFADSSSTTSLEDGAEEKAFDGRLEPGTLETLPAGKKITFPNPPQVTGYKEIIEINLQAIAVSGGVTYESISGNMGNVNFSSGRMGWLEMQRNIEKWQWNYFIPQFCKPVMKWFVEGMELKGSDSSRLTMSWTPPKRVMIDPTNQVTANNKAIRSGQISWAESMRERGYDPDEMLEEVQEYNQRFDKMGIIFDSDPRKTMEGGSLQTQNETEKA
jgi:lambda family phage portal protein